MHNGYQSSSKKAGEYWLIWRFEGEATLTDLMQSKEFPYNVSTFIRNVIKLSGISIFSLELW